MRGKTRRTIPPRPGQAHDLQLRAFFKDLARENVAPLTIKGYTDDVAHFVRWYEAHVSPHFAVKDLALKDLRGYKARMVNVDRLKAATVNRRLHAVKRLSRWAAGAGVIREDVGRTVKSVRVGKRGGPRGLARREINALLRAAHESPYGQGRRNDALIRLILGTGIRLGEAAALKLGDVELRPKSGWLHVRHGKERRLPLDASAREALREYLKTRGSREDDALFLSQRGGEGLSERGIEAIISEAARRAKLKAGRVSAHRLRHVFALMYLKDHPSALVRLGALLGHESPDTAAIYTQPPREDPAGDGEKTPRIASGS